MLRKHFFPPNNANVQITALSLFLSFIFWTIRACIFRSFSVSQEDSKPRKAKCLKTHSYILKNGKQERNISTRIPSGSAACDSASQLLYCMKCCLLTCRKEMHIWWRTSGQTTYLELICVHFRRESERKKKEYKVSFKYEDGKKTTISSSECQDDYSVTVQECMLWATWCMCISAECHNYHFELKLGEGRNQWLKVWS